MCVPRLGIPWIPSDDETTRFQGGITGHERGTQILQMIDNTTALGDGANFQENTHFFKKKETQIMLFHKLGILTNLPEHRIYTLSVPNTLKNWEMKHKKEEREI
jgi:hypothetical protein